VSDKTGLKPLAKALHRRGVKLYSTGGTFAFLSDTCELPAEKIESLTGFPEMMDGRVKTLHPKVFGGILARRDMPEDLVAADRHGIPLFDLVVVNLYPFSAHLGKPVSEQIAFVDIGGPAMLRAASKNFQAVTVLSDPADYEPFLAELEAGDGSTRVAFRQAQAVRTFERTCRYDAMIASQWSDPGSLPQTVSLTPQHALRYGENPHQKAAWCPGEAGQTWKVLQGKELSYNNLLDAESALRIVMDFSEPTVAIIKHNNPCGAATAVGPTGDGEAHLTGIFARALATDSKSAFGGIVAVNRPIDEATAMAMSQLFLEVILAPGFDPGALDTLSKKKNLRLIEWPKPFVAPYEVRAALGGWLVQESDRAEVPSALTTATRVAVPEGAWGDLRFAWRIAKHVRSNAIVIAKNGATLGIGAGQMSRVDAVGIALQKCPEGSTAGAVLASDAFFPFRDNIDLLKGRGITAVIQPGGSQRDGEVIEACNELGIALVLTGRRHFRH
jgi:phosphoribosylaminoimidazolecarboxamide formyltransferase/IMP cyclohydrolase